ncbi:MAG: hypothetical protein ACPG5B_06870 [Chitinophagales bacterium]
MKNIKPIQAIYTLLVEVILREFKAVSVTEFISNYEFCQNKIDKYFTFYQYKKNNVSVSNLLYYIQMGISYECEKTPTLLNKKMANVKHLLVGEEWTMNNFLRILSDASMVQEQKYLKSLITVDLQNIDIIIASASFRQKNYKKVVKILEAAHAMPFDREENNNNGVCCIYIRNQYVSPKYQVKLEKIIGVRVECSIRP